MPDASAPDQPGNGHHASSTESAVGPRRTARGRLVFWILLAGAAVAAFAGVPAVLVFGPLLAYGILRFGLATFNSLEAGADHIPDSDPVPVDPREERTTYWCSGCGAEVLLVVRGAPVPPRHCGERMQERRLFARDVPPSMG